MKLRAAPLRLAAAVLIFVSALFFSAVASAMVTDFVAEGPDGDYYQYDYEELLESYVLHILTGEGQIYSHYAQMDMRALLDSTRGYVDYADVLEAYAVAVISGKTFHLDAYTSSEGAKEAAMPQKVVAVGLGENNELTFTPIYLDPAQTVLELVNEASTSGEMKELLSAHGESLGLNLEAYNGLNSFGKDGVAAGMLEQRPGEGFADVEALTVLFQEVVEKAAARLAAAVAAVNEAADPEGLEAAVLEEAEVLGICQEAYSQLEEEEKRRVWEDLFSGIPFESAGQIKAAFDSAVATAGEPRMVIFYSDYDYTMEEMVDIQMTRSPQTDLYGGGWKDAKREDVELYVNPQNFLDPHLGDEEKELIRITASVLNVRENPTTTASGILTKVYQGEMYPVEEAREADPDTAPGTGGVWYKIKANQEVGWVCGLYVELTRATMGSSMFQFLVLSGSTGVSLEDLGNILEGRGILCGTEESFLEGSLLHDINEIFLVSLALHETGNGRSTLANGIEFEDRDDLFPDQDTVTVYNMFGIGAYDSNPNYLGAQYAYNARWFTPEEAILGGAGFASNSYINHSTYRQNTLYKMRWNPARPGRHQYATDIGWAVKQVGRIRNLYNQCSRFHLEFDIPRYKEG